MHPEMLIVGSVQKLMVQSVLRYSRTGRYDAKLLAKFSQALLAEPARVRAWAEADRCAYWREMLMRNQNLSDAAPNEFVVRYQNLRRAMWQKD